MQLSVLVVPAPTGSEAADVSFSTVEEAYMQFTSGTNVGDAGEVEIYYRQAGATGWSDKWDIYYGTDCAPVTTYNSYQATPSIIFQVRTYELLVWDTAGDGSGNNAGVIQWYMLTLDQQQEPSQIRHLAQD